MRVMVKIGFPVHNIVKRHSDQYKDGNGDVVRWTGEDVISGYGKVTFRPADGHELKLGAVIQDYDDVISGSSGSSSAERPGGIRNLRYWQQRKLAP